VGQVADASSGVASYPVTITFTDATGTYHAGATASVDITYGQKADVVQVSSRAVTTTNGTSTVTVRTAGAEDEVRTVTTGLTAGGMVEVTSGLKAGDQVVVSFPGRPPGASATGGAGTGTGSGAAGAGGN
jgi:macrolide-specific efflux system membrane fusion protein